MSCFEFFYYKNLVVSNLRSFQDKIWNRSPTTEGKEGPKKEADPSRLVNDRFNKQGDLYTKFILGGLKRSRFLHLPTRILKVYIAALSEFRHMRHPDGLNNTLLSQGCVLENDSHCRKGGQNVHSRDGGGGWGASNCPSLVCCQPVATSSQTSSNKNGCKTNFMLSIS